MLLLTRLYGVREMRIARWKSVLEVVAFVEKLFAEARRVENREHWCF